MGEVLAEGTKARGASCLLGPAINIHRSPLGGRAFERFAEDHLLTGKIAGAYVAGLQDNGSSATIKHFVCNDQEHDRMGFNSRDDDRALREVYLKAFQFAHKIAQPWEYMTVKQGLWGARFGGSVAAGTKSERRVGARRNR